MSKHISVVAAITVSCIVASPATTRTQIVGQGDRLLIAPATIAVLAFPRAHGRKDTGRPNRRGRGKRRLEQSSNVNVNVRGAGTEWTPELRTDRERWNQLLTARIYD